MCHLHLHLRAEKSCQVGISGAAARSPLAEDFCADRKWSATQCLHLTGNSPDTFQQKKKILTVWIWQGTLTSVFFSTVPLMFSCSKPLLTPLWCWREPVLFEIWLTELAKQGGEYILILNPLYAFFPLGCDVWALKMTHFQIPWKQYFFSLV